VAITKINISKNVILSFISLILICMNVEFYVYQLKTSSGEIFYIGKGSGNRMYKHIQIAKGNSVNRKRNPKLYNKISLVVKNGGYIIPEILFKSNSENECFVKETELISVIGKSNLCNLTDGGEGTSGYSLSDETKKRISAAKTGIKRVFTEEHKQRISQGMMGRVSPWKGKTLPEEMKRKMSESGKGKNAGPISEKRRQSIIDGIKRKKFEKNGG
jgi:hypothetical protein